MLKIKGKSNVITTFPDNIIDEGGNTNKYVISGSIEQTSIPTPTNPVTPIECGDLVTSGEHQGKYQIPINVNGTASYIYLDEPLRKIGIYSDIVSGTGSVIRRVCKYEITGNENVSYAIDGNRCGIRLNRMDDYVHQPGFVVAICSHFKMQPNGTDIANMEDNSAMLYSVWGLDRIWFRYDNAPDSGSSENNILKFLKDQYSAGTPVTIWVATEDEITSTTTAPTLTLINGSNNISINTTLAPSMMRINYNVEKLEESSYTEFPVEYTSNEGTLSKYSINGNMSQTGTPTPDSPIIPNECGDKTENLWDNRGFSATAINLNYTHSISNTYGTTISTTEGNEVTVTQSAYPTGNTSYTNGFFFIDVDFSRYAVGDVITISFDYIVNEIHALSTQMATTIYAGTASNAVPCTLSSGDWKISGRLTATIIIIADMKPYVEVRLCGNSITVKNIMLNSGSTPLPYEPYGYRIPIETNKIYLNEPLYGIDSYKDYINGYTGECTRQIKKLVLTGTEAWTKSNTRQGSFYTQIEDVIVSGQSMCDRAVNAPKLDDYVFGNVYMETTSYGGRYLNLWLFDSNLTVTDFKTYLAQQYANGTPVTIWYVLATPTTETITLPSNPPSSIKGYLTQSTTPTPTNPVYPTYNGKLKSNNKYEIFNTNGSEIGNTNYIYTKEPIRKIGDYSDTINNDGSINRIIGKLVLDGTEAWQFYSDSSSTYGAWQFYVNSILSGMPYSSALSNIAEYGVTATSRATYPYGVYLVTSGTGVAFQTAGAKDTFTGISAWKSYLATQYSNGTPVTVWYILNTPTTDTTITTPPTINTNKGLNTININTNLLPSKLTITYPIGEWIETYYNKLINNNITSNELPISFNSDSNSLNSISIKGNMNQSTTPSPDSPIIPEECGDRTENLAWTGWAEDFVSRIGMISRAFIEDGILHIYANAGYQEYDTKYVFKTDWEENTQYTVNFTYRRDSQYTYTNILQFTYTDGTNQKFPAMINDGEWHNIYVTSEAGKTIKYINVWYSSNWIEIKIDSFFVYLGTEQKPYSPYGYKLDILSVGEQLFDKDSATLYTATLQDADRWAILSNALSVRIPCIPNTQYTLSVTTPLSIFRIAEVSVDAVPEAGAFVPANRICNLSNQRKYTFTTSSTAKYIIFQGNSSMISTWIVELMLNLGNIAKPYSPYSRTTTPIYLGEIQTTRQIKKYEFTGTENWTQTTNGAYYLPTTSNPIRDYKYIDGNISINTHFPSQNTVSGSNGVNNGKSTFFYPGSGSGGTREYYIAARNIPTADDFKAYLAQQYANGTPVTVWYVLADEETGIVNEPIRKIGDYTDTINIPKSTISIPTVIGTNIIDINTTLPPSEVTIETKQWKPTVPKKYNLSSNTWNYDWTTFRELVRSGNAEKVFPIGTILYEEWGNPNSTAYQIIAYNKHFDSKLTALGYTYSVTLCQVFVTYGVPFDCAEAMLAVTKAALPAGKYKFTIPDYDASYGGNKTYHFETTKNVPVGGQVCLEWRYHAVPRTIRTYSTKTSIDALESYGTDSSPLPEWNETDYPNDIDLGTVTYSTTATTNTYGIFNHIQRARYGSNNYYQSRIRQYINGTTNWWSPQTIFDRPTDWNVTTLPTNGLLSSMNADFLNVLATPTISSVTNQVFEYVSLDGTTFAPSTSATVFNTYDVNDKIFLLSHTEVNISTNPNIGSVLDYYIDADNAKRIKYDIISGTRSITGDVTNVGAVENPVITGSTARYWWFRIPHPSYAHYERNCHTSGALDYNGVCLGYGCTTACVIQ